MWRETRFKLVCPHCGRVGRATWTARFNVVSCPGCGLGFGVGGNTYRPVHGTAGAARKADNDRTLAYYYDHHEERKRKMREYYREHRHALRKKQAAYRERNRDIMNERKRAKRRGEAVPDMRRRENREMIDDGDER